MRHSAVRRVGSLILFSLLFFSICLFLVPRTSPLNVFDKQAQPDTQFSDASSRHIVRARTPGQPHGAISIQNDSAFASQALAEGWPGDGNSTSPYRIESLDIVSTAGAESCIAISNTRVHFIVQDCSLQGASQTDCGGIVLFNVSYGQLVNNSCFDNFHGIMVRNSTRILVQNNLCGLNWAGIACNDSTAVVVTRNQVSDSTGGIRVELSSNCEIRENLCFNCTEYAIRLCVWAANNMLWNNTCMGGGEGISIWDAGANYIGGSSIFYNALGILCWPESNLNRIESNAFVNNALNALDDGIVGSRNTFDFNYWSDYHGPDADGDGVGDIPYSIPGIGHNYDYYPLMVINGSGITWLETPTDQYFPYGFPIRYDLNATATAPGLNQWWLSDSTLFAINQYGVLTSNVTVLPGAYWVQVWVSDWKGNVITAGFNIVVYAWTIGHSPALVFIIETIAAVSTATFISAIGIALLRQRRTSGPPTIEPFGDKRPPISQWNARCPLCGSHLFGDEDFCPGCGNRVDVKRRA